jgi:acetyltransferase-like isoleucine patch superfamily enzyme
MTLKWQVPLLCIRLAYAKLRYWRQLRLSSFSIALEKGTELRIDRMARGECGRRVYLQTGCRLEAHNEAVLRIGNRVSFNRGCSIVAHYGIEIGDETIFGEYVTIYDHNHYFDNPSTPLLRLQGYRGKPVCIGRNVWIGTSVFVGAGVTIGDNCVIGAHTIITQDILANSVVYGKVQLVVKPRCA